MNVEKIEKDIEEFKQSMKDRTAAVKNADDGAADLKKLVELAKSLEELEKERQAVVADKSSGNEQKCLEDQLGYATVGVGKTERELGNLKAKVKYRKKMLKENKTKLLSKRGEAADAEKNMKIRQKEVENVEKALKDLSYEEGQMEILEKDRMVESKAVLNIKEEIRNISARLGNVEFSYRDPVKNLTGQKSKVWLHSSLK